jgi:hypothetical protein
MKRKGATKPPPSRPPVAKPRRPHGPPPAIPPTPHDIFLGKRLL